MMLSLSQIERIKNGLSYQEFIEKSINKRSSSDRTFTDHEKFEITKLNIQRSARIDKTYSPSEDILNQLGKITSPQIWFVLTEDWCGDSAQNLPYIARFVKANNEISLTILERDKNLDLMNEYLTNGTMSIPILVSFDKNMNELFRWGPRPEEAISLVTKLKSEAKKKDELMKELHLWYSKNKGKALEKEFTSLLKNLIPVLETN